MKKKLLLALCIMSVFPFYVSAYSNYIYAGGDNIGIEISSSGVLVVGIGENSSNKSIKVGDYIEEVNGYKVNDVDSLVSLINKYQKDGMVTLKVRRNGKKIDVNYELINIDGKYKTGLFVKDSISGIGTLTYIDPGTNIYGALGHEIVESNSKSTVEIDGGYIFESDVSSIDRSFDGHPGTKNAKLNKNSKYGTIEKNTKKGIYGNYSEKRSDDLVQVGNASELKLGKATIRTVLNTSEIKEYEINITKIDKKSDIKNIYFEITDAELLAKTGGVIQGMSGSPILQDGKIFGAVTHVVVEDVKSGYGIFITTMLNEGEN